jgi:rifampin ADP-ribosylating transferase
VLGEVVGWQGHSVELLQQMKNGLEKLTAEGTNVIID